MMHLAPLCRINGSTAPTLASIATTECGLNEKVSCRSCDTLLKVTPLWLMCLEQNKKASRKQNPFLSGKNLIHYIQIIADTALAQVGTHFRVEVGPVFGLWGFWG